MRARSARLALPQVRQIPHHVKHAKRATCAFQVALRHGPLSDQRKTATFALLVTTAPQELQEKSHVLPGDLQAKRDLLTQISVSHALPTLFLIYLEALLALCALLRRLHLQAPQPAAALVSSEHTSPVMDSAYASQASSLLTSSSIVSLMLMERETASP